MSDVTFLSYTPTPSAAPPSTEHVATNASDAVTLAPALGTSFVAVGAGAGSTAQVANLGAGVTDGAEKVVVYLGGSETQPLHVVPSALAGGTYIALEQGGGSVTLKWNKIAATYEVQALHNATVV